MAHGPRKKQLDFGDYLNHVTFRSGLWLGLRLSFNITHNRIFYRQGVTKLYPTTLGMFYPVFV